MKYKYLTNFMMFTDLVSHSTQPFTSFTGKRFTFSLQSSFSVYSHIKEFHGIYVVSFVHSFGYLRSWSIIQRDR
jgi:hypothetical protein